MAPRLRKLKNQSVGMSESPLDRPTVFIDRNSGGRTFRDLVVEQGLPLVLHDDHFPPTTADEDWLRAVGDRGWLVVTGDDAVTRSPLFLLNLNRTRSFVFILHGLNGSSRNGKAACVVKSYPLMVALSQKNTPPKLWRIGRDGKAREFDFSNVLDQMKRGRRL